MSVPMSPGPLDSFSCTPEGDVATVAIKLLNKRGNPACGNCRSGSQRYTKGLLRFNEVCAFLHSQRLDGLEGAYLGISLDFDCLTPYFSERSLTKDACRGNLASACRTQKLRKRSITT